MTRKRSSAIALAAILSISAFLASDQAAMEPSTVPEMKAALVTTNKSNRSELNATGGLQRDFFLVDSRTLKDARDLAKYQHEGLAAVFADAGVQMPASTGTGHQDPGSRGIIGDIDLADLSRADYEKVLAAAAKRGYTVQKRAGSATIVELDATTFFKKTDSQRFDVDVWKDPEHLSSVTFDPKKGMVVESPFLYAADNIKKTHGALTIDPALLKDGDLQGLAKATRRIMETGGEGSAGIKDVLAKIERQMKEHPGEPFGLDLKEQLALVKSGYSPEAAGIVKPGATPEEAARDLAAFQSACKREVEKVWTAASAERQRQDATLQADFDAAVAKGDAQAARKLKAELLEYRSMTLRAQAGAVQNGGMEALADLKGYKLNKEVLPGGEVRYRVEGKQGYFLESELRADILSKEQKALAQTHGADPEPKKNAQAGGKRAAITRTAGFILDFANYYQAASMAEEEIMEGMTGDESMALLVGEQMLKTAVYSSALYGYGDTLVKAWSDSEDRYYDDLVAGKDPSKLWAILRGTGTAGAKIIWDQSLGSGMAALTGTWGMIREGTGLISDSLDQRSAEEEARLMDERVAAYRAELDKRRGAVRTAFSGAVEEYRRRNEERLRQEADDLRDTVPLKSFDPDKAFDDFLAEYAVWRNQTASDAYAAFHALLKAKGQDDPETKAARQIYEQRMKDIEALTGPEADARHASIKARAMADADALRAYRAWAAASGLPPELAQVVSESAAFTAEQREGQAKVLSLAADMPQWDGKTLKLRFQASMRTIAFPYYGYETSINWVLYWPTQEGAWNSVAVDVTPTLRERVEKGDSGLFDKTYDLIITKDLGPGSYPKKGARAYLAGLGMPMNPQGWSRPYYTKHLVLTLPPWPED